jgi:phasin family protein
VARVRIFVTFRSYPSQREQQETFFVQRFLETTMYQAPEQLLILNKTNLEAAVRFAGIALEGAERLIEAQTKAVKSAFADGVHQANELLKVKDFEELTQHAHIFTQPKLEKAGNYVASICEIAAATHAEISELLERQIDEFNNHCLACCDRMVKCVPAGADVAGATINSALSKAGSVGGNTSRSAEPLAEMHPESAGDATRAVASGGKKKAS